MNLLFIFLFGTIVKVSNAQTLEWVQDGDILAPSELVDYDYFGYSSTMYGTKLAIGGKDFALSPESNVFTFQWNGTAWVQDSHILTPATSYDLHNYGSTLSMYGDKLAIGAYYDDTEGNNKGAVYTYRWNGTTWVEDNILLSPSELLEDDLFGYAVSMYDDKLVISAVGDDNERGSVYTFQWNGTAWVQDAGMPLFPEDIVAGEIFGRKISMYSDKFVVGSYDSGYVYTYQWNGSAWEQVSKITVDNSNGDSLSTYNNKLAVGAWYNSSGAVYTFQWNGTTWVQDDIVLIPQELESNDQFGYSVSMYGDRLAVGANYDDGNGINRGATYTFKWNGTAWDQDSKILTPDELDDGAFFGTSVLVYDDNLIVGAYGQGSTDKGAIYTFSEITVTNSPTSSPTAAPCYCNNNGECRKEICHCVYPYYGQHCDEIVECESNC